MGHLEDPTLTSDLTVARDFDLGMTGPPLSISMDFIAGGLVEMIGGLASAMVLAAYAWWAPMLLAGAWLATHWLLRESGVWRDRNTEEVRSAQRDADYAYRLAVDPPAEQGTAAVRPGRLDARIASSARRTRLHDLQYEATRLREQPMVWSLLLVLAANLARVLVDSRSARRAGSDQPGRRGHLRAERDRHVDDRVRRTELGTRRRGGTGRRGAAARIGRWALAGALAREPARPQPACPRARFASATSGSPTGRGAARRCSNTSI